MATRLPGLFFSLLSLMIVAGCGQKGPLFLPGDTSEVSMSIPAQQAETEDEDDDDQEDDNRQR